MAVRCISGLIYTLYEQYISSGIKCHFQWRCTIFHIFLYFLLCLFSLLSMPHILCVYSLRPGSVHIWACGHRTVVFTHFTRTHPCAVTWHDGQSHVQLLWRSLYWVNGTLYCKNLSRIKVWTARERSVRGMCLWKETVACREKILANNAEWLCGVFRLCVYRYLRLFFVTRLSHWSWYSNTADIVKRILI
jgi:hypothetical protein